MSNPTLSQWPSAAIVLVSLCVLKSKSKVGTLLTVNLLYLSSHKVRRSQSLYENHHLTVVFLLDFPVYRQHLYAKHTFLKYWYLVKTASKFCTFSDLWFHRLLPYVPIISIARLKRHTWTKNRISLETHERLFQISFLVELSIVNKMYAMCVKYLYIISALKEILIQLLAWSTRTTSVVKTCKLIKTHVNCLYLSSLII